MAFYLTDQFAGDNGAFLYLYDKINRLPITEHRFVLTPEDFKTLKISAHLTLQRVFETLQKYSNDLGFNKDTDKKEFRLKGTSTIWECEVTRVGPNIKDDPTLRAEKIIATQINTRLDDRKNLLRVLKERSEGKDPVKPLFTYCLRTRTLTEIESGALHRVNRNHPPEALLRHVSEQSRHIVPLEAVLTPKTTCQNEKELEVALINFRKNVLGKKFKVSKEIKKNFFEKKGDTVTVGEFIKVQK